MPANDRAALVISTSHIRHYRGHPRAEDQPEQLAHSLGADPRPVDGHLISRNRGPSHRFGTYEHGLLLADLDLRDTFRPILPRRSDESLKVRVSAADVMGMNSEDAPVRKVTRRRIALLAATCGVLVATMSFGQIGSAQVATGAPANTPSAYSGGRLMTADPAGGYWTVTGVGDWCGGGLGVQTGCGRND